MEKYNTLLFITLILLTFGVKSENKQLNIENGQDQLPNDPLMLPNDIISYHQYHLNNRANGLSIDYPATWEYAQGHALIGMVDLKIRVDHPDLTGNLRFHLSNPNLLVTGEQYQYWDHGSWVLGVLAPSTNNSEGLAGVCQNCSVIVQGGDLLDPEGFSNLMRAGVQAVNMSFGYPTNMANCPAEGLASSELCDVLDELHERDIMLASAAANRMSNSDPIYQEHFPANHPNVIAVGGVTEAFEFWDDCSEPPLLDDYTCGSYASDFQELVAPAKHILTAATADINGTESKCLYLTHYWQDPDYDICSGTSFSTPQVVGLIGILRSIYPQMKSDDVRTLLQKTAQSPHDHWTQEWGHGMINPLASVTAVLGTVNGFQQMNRVKPVFVIKSTKYESGPFDTLYSASPQVITAALLGDLYGLDLGYQSLQVGLTLSDYQIPATDTHPNAAFHILSTHNNPDTDQGELIKLYRLTKYVFGDDPIFDLAYITEPYLSDFTDSGYDLDAMEGYIYPACPEDMEECIKPAYTECLYARNVDVDYDDWALITESQLNQPPYENHTLSFNDDECLGYVYTSVDSDDDGLIDGYEAMIGTDLNTSDSDSDGRSDGQEMLIPIDGFFSDPMVFDDLIYESGFQTENN